MSSKVLIALLFIKKKMRGWLKKLRTVYLEPCFMAIKITVMTVRTDTYNYERTDTFCN